jgi:opacity protein-like surface antigen
MRMREHLRSVVLLASLLILAVDSAAADGLYGQLNVGRVFSQPTSFERVDGPNSTIGNPAFPMEGDLGASVVFGGALGYAFNQAFRADVSLHFVPDLRAVMNHRQNSDSSRRSITEGDIESLIAMVNGHVHPLSLFDPAKPVRVSPFLSVGLGMAHHDAGTLRTFPGGGFANAGNLPFVTPGGDGTSLAWSVGAGLDVRVAGPVLVSFAYTFRDLGTFDYDRGRLLDVAANTVEPFGAVRGPRIRLHTLGVGIRVGF